MPLDPLSSPTESYEDFVVRSLMTKESNDEIVVVIVSKLATLSVYYDPADWLSVLIHSHMDRLFLSPPGLG
jgi:hypothetical protein